MGLYDYSLEPEFKLAAPRRVSFTKSALLLRAFLIVALLVSIILTPIYALKDIHHLGYLISNCRPVQGEITGRTTKIEKLYTAYYLTFSYAVHGRSFDGVERVPEEDYEMNSKGAPITLAYLPQNPTVHFIGTITGDTMRVGITNWIGRALVIVGFFAVFGAAQSVEPSALREDGPRFCHLHVGETRQLGTQRQLDLLPYDLPLLDRTGGDLQTVHCDRIDLRASPRGRSCHDSLRQAQSPKLPAL